LLVAVLCAQYRMHSLSYDIVRCTAWRSISRYRVIDIGPIQLHVIYRIAWLYCNCAVTDSTYEL